jgi:short-subunit dehydrogenase involved in D-alanine esterification of teichoic acids
LATFDLELLTNYTLSVHLTKEILPFFQGKKGETSVIFTIWNLGLAPVNFCPGYCASKAALHRFILVLREQMKDGGLNIKVCEGLPPAVRTELHDPDKQPYIQNGREIGMPMAEFVKETWEGLTMGKEQIPVGMTHLAFDSWEQERQRGFHATNEALKEVIQGFYDY